MTEVIGGLSCKEYICAIEICNGYCCEHISDVVRKNLIKLGLKFEQNGEGEYRCLKHNKETGLCNDYDNRTWYCAWFYCPSAIRGFMKMALEEIDKKRKLQRDGI